MKARFVWILAACLVLLLIICGVLRINPADGGGSADRKGPSGSRDRIAANGEAEDPASTKPAKLPRKPPGADGAQSLIERKMKEIIIPIIDFEDTSVEEAIDFLRLRSRELDPEEVPELKGISFMIRKPRGENTEDASSEADSEAGLGVTANSEGIRIKELQLRDVSLWDALHRVADECGLKVEITDQAIELRPR